MQKAAAAKWLLMASAIVLQGQTPNEVKIDSPQARVLVVTVEPHHRSALHEHPMNRVMIYLGDGQLIRTNAAGVAEKIDFKTGDVKWSPAEGKHTSEYLADHPFKIVEVELKTRREGSITFPSNDPAKVDPKHYSVEFENNQVRVLRVRFGAHEKGVLHQHKLIHLVVYLNDQARGKAGEVRLDEPTTHTEENPLDHMAERIAIDFK
jgi:quercetin dioxygenase-like cupin family protein